MAQKKLLTKSAKTGVRQTKSASPGKRKKGRGLSSPQESSKRRAASMDDVLEFYKPLKKPVTLRLDADVLAWFKGGGRKYQTRINAALRKLMVREMKAAG